MFKADEFVASNYGTVFPVMALSAEGYVEIGISGLADSSNVVCAMESGIDRRSGGTRREEAADGDY